MHRQFRTLLNEAQGVSEFVIAAFVDIRGFSAFSQRNESPDTAMFVKRVYARLIDHYFDFASFYKPTGDGLMVIIPFSESTLAEVSARTIRASLACVEEFPKICHDDPMVNFEVPERIGLGIARGTACKIFSADKTLDYSGRLLNLAARLTHLAQPSGVVVDGEFKLQMIPESERGRFRSIEVYLRGIAETTPHTVFAVDWVTKLPPENLSRLGEPMWQTVQQSYPLREWKHLAPRFALDLKAAPKNLAQLVVEVRHPKFLARKRVPNVKTSNRLTIGEDYTYSDEAGVQRVILNLPVILAALRKRNLPLKEPVTILAKYPVS